jgi:hypothetical protein
MKKTQVDEPFRVQILPLGVDETQECAWYSIESGKEFEVLKSKKWSYYYEVVSGKYKDRPIDPKHCKRITPTN